MYVYICVCVYVCMCMCVCVSLLKLKLMHLQAICSHYTHIYVPVTFSITSVTDTISIKGSLKCSTAHAFFPLGIQFNSPSLH